MPRGRRAFCSTSSTVMPWPARPRMLAKTLARERGSRPIEGPSNRTRSRARTSRRWDANIDLQLYGHAAAVLAFELANRAYFAASVSDRGDEFYDQFADRHSALLAEHEASIGAFYVLVAEDGSVLGRFNLYDFEDGTANLGYWVAQHVAGRGVATATVRELCQLAAARHELRTLRVVTANAHVASQKVLTKAGFVPVGPADPAGLGGKPGTWYQRDLALQP
jgi:ribosomal-protein-alanine N-acetyltransferase